jgi:hypothetical protein
MKILYNDSIKHGKNSTLEIKLCTSQLKPRPPNPRDRAGKLTF